MTKRFRQFLRGLWVGLPSLAASGQLPEFAPLAVGASGPDYLTVGVRIHDYVYQDGPQPERTGDREFRGGAVVENGRIVMIPRTGQFIGEFDPATGAMVQTRGHGQPGGFGMASVIDGHLVVMTPRGSRNVGLYDARTQEYRDGAAHGQRSDNAFLGSAKVAPDLIVFGPLNAGVIGLYDPRTDTYRDGPAVDAEGPFRFSLIEWSARTGLVVFVPFDSHNVGLYDPANNSYRRGAEHGADTGNAYSGAAELADGRFVMAPRHAMRVGLYDPASDTFTAGPKHGEGRGAFMAAARMPDGLVLMAPFRADHIGIYDPVTETYRSGPSVAHVPGVEIGRFSGAIVVGDSLVMTNRAANVIGLVHPQRFFTEHGPGQLRLSYRLLDDGEWQQTPAVALAAPGLQKFTLIGLTAASRYEIRAVLEHPQVHIEGAVVIMDTPAR